MKEHRKYLNLGLGVAASYLYMFTVGISIGFTPIRPSSFLLARCAHETVGTVSTYCKGANWFSMTAYDALHFFMAALLLALMIGLFQKLLTRIGYPYRFGLLAIGFIVGSGALTLWFSDSETPMSWFLIAHWLTEIGVFVVVYFLVAKHVLALGSPNESLQPTPEARG